MTKALSQIPPHKNTQECNTTLGIVGTDREILIGTLIAAQTEASQGIAEMMSLLKQDDSDLADILLLFGNANGLQELRDELAALLADLNGSAPAQGLALRALASTSLVCDQILPTYCKTTKIADVLEKTSTVVGFLCNTLLVGAGAAIVFPGDGPVLDVAAVSAWLAACAKVEGGLAVAGVVSGIVSKFDADLKLTTDKTKLEANQSATITPQIEFAGIDEVCKIGVGQGTDYIADKLAEKAVFELLRRKIGRTATQTLFELKGGDFLNSFLLKLQAVIKEIVNQTQVGSAIENLAGTLCDRYSVGVALTADASLILKAPSPNVGGLSFNPDGTASYRCPEPVPINLGPIEIAAEKDICGKTQKKTVTISCVEGTGTVTITIGDNGSANDDIYEVQIDGRTVLTSSVPVRATSTTIDLPVGVNEIKMIGRAAPDGIGTYYMTFSGDVSSVSGDRTSGSDLTPGTVKTFFVTVVPR